MPMTPEHKRHRIRNEFQSRQWGAGLPQAGRSPAFPVVADSSWPPFPRSSVPAWTTTVLCKTACQNPFATTIIVATRTHSQNAVGPNQLNDVVLHAALGDGVGIRLDVAQVADVPDVVRGRAVGLAVRVEVRAGRGAAIGVVAKLVDVHATLGVGICVMDLVLDHRGGMLVLLRELDGARDAGIAAEDSNCGGGEGSAIS